MNLPRVGIIGGGPGGLMTAYTLEKMVSTPVSTVIFEASSRLGGKILTPLFSTAPVRYEAGAAEFYDYSNLDYDSLKLLIAELGLTISPMGGPAVVIENQLYSNLDDIEFLMGRNASKAFLEFDRQARDTTTRQEFYHSDDPEGILISADQGFEPLLRNVSEHNMRRFIETMIHSDLATEPVHTSMQYGLQNYLMNDPGYMQLYGIVGGNEQLPNELAARITSRISLNSSVKNIRKKDNQLCIKYVQSGQEREEEFDFVVIALPHNYLNSINYEGNKLQEAMQKHHAHYNYPAHYLRVTLLFERPFWRDSCNDSYWMLDQFGGCCLYDESSRDPSCQYGILGWLLAGEAAEKYSHLEDQELIQAALKSLPSIHTVNQESVLEGRVHRWIGAVNAIPGGKMPVPHDRRHQPEPIQHPNLYVVGDYLFDSTLNGVLDSAQYVASWLAAQLADNSFIKEVSNQHESRIIRRTFTPSKRHFSGELSARVID